MAIARVGGKVGWDFGVAGCMMGKFLYSLFVLWHEGKEICDI